MLHDLASARRGARGFNSAPHRHMTDGTFPWRRTCPTSFPRLRPACRTPLNKERGMDHPHVGEMSRAQNRLWTAPFCVSLVCMAIVALAVSRLRNQVGIVVALLSLGAV